MATRTEYARVTFLKSVRVFSGVSPKQGLDAKLGVRMFRVTDGQRDDLVIEVAKGDKRDPWEVPWANIASAQPAVLTDEEVSAVAQRAQALADQRHDAPIITAAAKSTTAPREPKPAKVAKRTNQEIADDIEATAPEKPKRQPKAPWKNEE